MAPQTPWKKGDGMARRYAVAYDARQTAWTWREAAQRAVEVLRDEGVQPCWCRILSETVYRRVLLLERRLDEPLPEVTSPLPVILDRLQATTMDAYTRLRPNARSQEVRQRLALGQRAFVVWYHGDMVHVGWTATERARIAFLDCEVVLAPDVVYQYESFTAPAWRGQNLAAVRIGEMARYFRSAGYRRLLAVVVPENQAALRPLVKTGYRLIGKMGYIKVGPWRCYFCRLRPRALSPGEQCPLALVR